jgi:hypothetical protein
LLQGCQVKAQTPVIANEEWMKTKWLKGTGCPSVWIILLLALTPISLQAFQSDMQPQEMSAWDIEEPFDSGWQFYFDNDSFLGSKKDRNYTGGIALTLSGRRVADYWFSTDGLLGKLDELSGFQNLLTDNGAIRRHSIEFGLTIFTPDDITATAPLPADHPYANLLFLANSRITTYPQQGRLYQSTLLLGLLGTRAGELVQKGIHHLVGSDAPQGWDNQISDGGELTGKYIVSMQQVLAAHQGDISYDLRGGLEGGIGVTTDVSASLSGRLGLLRAPWWHFTPHQSEYINLGQTLAHTTGNRKPVAEFYFWAGLRVKHSFYNAILQGQFRDSAVEFDRDQLESVILNGWIGAVKTFENGLGVSFVIQKLTSEIKDHNVKDPVWGGLVISKVY